MHPVSRSPSLRSSIALCALAAALAGCSTFENFVAGDKVDYKSAGTRTAGLEVPPDLTQLARDPRYQPNSSGSVSAAVYQSAASAPAAVATTQGVAPQSIGDMRIERQGNLRWLSTPIPAEQLWPQLQAFWKERGFALVVDQADSGVLETDWAENRSKLPNDVIRNTIGKVFDSLYSTGERDKFRTRVERSASGGSDVYITHRGVQEVFVGDRKETTAWQPRPADPQLEAEFLSRLMVKLGVRDEVAKAAVSAPGATAAARARVVEGQPAATLQVDDNFERAWRRVGLSLDRSGFTVEDRDRAQGLYFVRYVDASQSGKGEPGFLAKLFSWAKKDDPAGGPSRYRVLVKGAGEQSTVSVLNAQGAPENGETGKRIVALLVDDLK